MAVTNRKQIRKLSAAILAVLGAYVASAPAVFGQDASPMKTAKVNVPADAKLVLSSNELIYNKDSEIVTANGAVQINYGGYKMVSQQVVYNQKTGRMTAIGNVELITPDGNRMYGDKMDVTDSFSDGFVDSLRIEMPDNTRLASEKAERVGGTQMILTKGIYTACLACTKLGKAPLWQVKAQRVVQNGVTHTVRLTHARFELFGLPIAYIPWIEVPDNTVKRKSGFLFPSFSVEQHLGFGAKVPYYYVISPSMDATVTGTEYTTQGFMLEAEFRQRLENGTYTIRAAGIDQNKPEEFTANTSDAEAKGRGLVASKGDFQINPRWSFGWDVMAQTDNNFARTYGLKGLDESTHTNQIYLTGLGKRNYFDMRGFYYDVQDANDNSDSEKQQAIAAPVIDYHYVDPKPVYGGELSATMNFTNIARRENAVRAVTLDDLTTNRFQGLKGDTSRLTTELQWQRTFATQGGLLLTPLMAARGDAYGLGMDSPSASYSGNYDDSATAAQGMLTAGIEAKYPIMVSTANSTHVFEPIAQLYARPNESLAGRLPNEDAQSFVFDASNLFSRDKFSGFDRIEGGTRANVGIRYTGSFDSGYKLTSIVGQSYQLVGQNSFDTSDLVNAGAESGLEDSVSDYVAMASLSTPQGLSLTGSYRLDHKDMTFKRGDSTLGYANADFQTSVTYTHITAQPTYGFTSDQDEIQTRAQINFKDYWAVFGTVSYDLNKDNVTRRGIGLSYSDECTIFSLSYLSKSDNSDLTASDWSIGAKITFRTLGDINVGSASDTTF
ncbi:LPS-assembly protein LptD [Rhizobium sp. HT1-10]|uniref:LPS-assembly protein LptD n=1 Tax=Rhizobium sp. HT1-10 TaxID=3111638 RepID=UPI003C1C68F3